MVQWSWCCDRRRRWVRRGPEFEASGKSRKPRNMSSNGDEGKVKGAKKRSKVLRQTEEEWDIAWSRWFGESDRGAAIVAGSYLEHALLAYIRFSVADRLDVLDELFRPMGPLSSFASMVSVAYAFGLIDRTTYIDLDAVRKIRNHFAHEPYDTSFDDDLVHDVSQKLFVYQMALDERFESRAEETKSPILMRALRIRDHSWRRHILRHSTNSALLGSRDRWAASLRLRP